MLMAMIDGIEQDRSGEPDGTYDLEPEELAKVPTTPVR